jgi:4-amino-4-deoxy-L-arabinose transferase-like glycosyltransferase
MATERDEVIAVVIFIGYAFQLLSIRKNRAILMLPFGLSLGMAILIKPTAALFAVVLLLFAYLALKQRARPPAAYLFWGIAGFGIIFVILLGFMLPDSLGPFLFLQRQAIPYYASLAPESWRYLLKNSLPAPFLLLIPIAVLLAILNRRRADLEIWALRASVVLGALSYFVQRKGYSYHRYSFMAFALLWFAIECTIAVKSKGWLRNFGVLGIGIAVLVVLPPRVNHLRHERHNSNPFADQLQADLQRLGGSSLHNRVQCLDMVTGCYSALYRLGIVQSTGFMGDTSFFAPNDGKSVPYYRKIFWDEMHNNPPRVIVLSSERFGVKYSFDKLNAWPQVRD